MAIPDNRLSTDPFAADYVDPDGRVTNINEDWEAGPIAIGDTTEGRKYQAWHLTFDSGDFTITPEDTGAPVVLLSGEDSVQCSFTFDQNGRPSLTWIDSAGNGYAYWYDTAGAGDYAKTIFQTPTTSVAMTMDDKRTNQIQSCDMILFYTYEEAGRHLLFCRYQRDRFDTPYPLKDPAWPYLHKCGMNVGLRVQLSMSTEAP